MSTLNAHTTQYIDDGSVVSPSNHRPFKFTTTAVRNLEDVSITSVLVEWRHGIYNTEESARFTVVSTAHAEDVLVHSDGSIEELDAGGRGPGDVGVGLHRALMAHLTETV